MHEVQVWNGTNHHQRKHGDKRQNLRQREIYRTNKSQKQPTAHNRVLTHKRANQHFLVLLVHDQLISKFHLSWHIFYWSAKKCAWYRILRWNCCDSFNRCVCHFNHKFFFVAMACRYLKPTLIDPIHSIRK
jgi:hypothetical protein